MTQKFTLTNDWTEIASGPCFIEAGKGIALLHFADAAPAADSDAFHKLGAGYPRHFSYGGSAKAFARTTQIGGAVVVTEGG